MRPGRIALASMGTMLVLLASAMPAVGQANQASAGWPQWYAGGDSLSAGVHAIEKDSTYSVRGSTAEALRSEMERRAPVVDGRRVQGAHFWEWWHHYEYAPAQGSRCQVTKSIVLVRSLIVLPLWEDQAASDLDLGRAWNGYRFRLRDHEDGHRTITLRSATELWDRVRSRPASPCSSLREDIRALADSVFQASADTQSAYDVETRHGLSQGARWPPG